MALIAILSLFFSLMGSDTPQTKCDIALSFLNLSWHSRQKYYSISSLKIKHMALSANLSLFCSLMGIDTPQTKCVIAL